MKAQVRTMIAADYSGTTKIKCSAGIADIVTREYIIEIKPLHKWMQAIGQALVYSAELQFKPAVYLFIINDNQIPIGAPEHDLSRLRPYFERLNVILLNDQYRPSPLATLPTEALIHIIATVLRVDPRALRQLALNRRIWGLASANWPQMLRAQLWARLRVVKYQSNVAEITLVDIISTDLTTVCAALSPLSGRPPTTTCVIKLTNNVTNQYNEVWVVGTDVRGRVGIALHNYRIVFAKYTDKYKPNIYNKRVPNPLYPSGPRYTLHEVTEPYLKAMLIQDIRYLMTKVLPELLDIFDLTT